MNNMENFKAKVGRNLDKLTKFSNAACVLENYDFVLECC